MQIPQPDNLTFRYVVKRIWSRLFPTQLKSSGESKAQRLLKLCLRWVTSIAIIFLLTTNLTVLAYKFVPIPFTPLMVIRFVEQVFDADLPVTFSYKWRSVQAISPNLPWAVMASEDQLFLDHHGFDIRSITKALSYNSKTKSGKIKGGSTISQQTAKNVFLWPSRTYLRKALEAYFTLLIELYWSKARIMHVYINVIEMGNGVYGAQAAAKKYFSSSAATLTMGNAASIAAILPSPRKLNPLNKSGFVAKRRSAILNQMRLMGRPKFDI